MKDCREYFTSGQGSKKLAEFFSGRGREVPIPVAPAKLQTFGVQGMVGDDEPLPLIVAQPSFHEAQVKGLVTSLQATWGTELPLQVIAFDQDVDPIYSGRAGEFGEQHAKKLLERGAAGASDLGQAFAWLAQHAPNQRVVVVTGGVVTAGAEGSELRKQIKALETDRVDFVLAGGLRDEAAMGKVVHTAA